MPQLNGKARPMHSPPRDAEPQAAVLQSQAAQNLQPLPTPSQQPVPNAPMAPTPILDPDLVTLPTAAKVAQSKVEYFGIFRHGSNRWLFWRFQFFGRAYLVGGRAHKTQLESNLRLIPEISRGILWRNAMRKRKQRLHRGVMELENVERPKMPPSMAHA